RAARDPDAGSLPASLVCAGNKTGARRRELPRRRSGWRIDLHAGREGGVGARSTRPQAGVGRLKPAPPQTARNAGLIILRQGVRFLVLPVLFVVRMVRGLRDANHFPVIRPV